MCVLTEPIRYSIIAKKSDVRHLIFSPNELKSYAHGYRSVAVALKARTITGI